MELGSFRKGKSHADYASRGSRTVIACCLPSLPFLIGFFARGRLGYGKKGENEGRKRRKRQTDTREGGRETEINGESYNEYSEWHPRKNDNSPFPSRHCEKKADSMK